MALLLLTGCTQKEQTNQTVEGSTTQAASAAATDPQTALETVTDGEEQEIMFSLDGNSAADSSPTLAGTTSAPKKTAPTAPESTAGKAEQDVTTKAAEQQTTTKPAAQSGQTQVSTTKTVGDSATLNSAGGKATTSIAATLPTADAEKDRYEMPAIPLK